MAPFLVQRFADYRQVAVDVLEWRSVGVELRIVSKAACLHYCGELRIFLRRQRTSRGKTDAQASFLMRQLTNTQ